MLDQSFSAHNFDTIYGLESRKGNIDIHDMPAEYKDIIKEIKDTNTAITDLRDKADTKSIEARLALKENLLQLQEKKKLVLFHYLDDIAEKVNSPSFRFNLLNFKLDGNEIFCIDTTKHEQFFAIKQLQYNLRNVFKVTQANRHQILSNIKVFLNSKIPVYVIRTDISKFFESISQKKLMKIVLDNPLLSYKSKAFIHGILNNYETIKDHKTINSEYGVPRGIGISSFLSELYMRDLDKKLASRKEVIFYARYVDDIFIILSSLPLGKNLNTYYNDIVAMFNDYELGLKQPKTSEKCMLIDMFNRENVPLCQFDYLGYHLAIKRTKGLVSCKFGMKKEKVTIIKKKIDNAIIHFNNLSVKDAKQAYRDLMDSLDYITGNIALIKTKSSIKTGLYYSNDLLDDFKDLKGLTYYLHSRHVSPYDKLNGFSNLRNRIQSKIAKIDFEKRWRERKFNRFTLDQIKKMDKWLNDEKA